MNIEFDKTGRRTAGVLALAALLAIPATARGQGNNSYARMLDTTRTLQQNLFTEMNRTNALRAQGEKIARGGQSTPRTQRPVARLPIATTDFAPLDAGHPVLNQFLDGLQLAPGPAATMRTAIIGVWGALEAKTRRNNLSASLGIAAAVATLVLTGQDPSDDALNEMIARINDAIGASPLWRGMAPRAKQQLSDSLLLTASMMLVYAELGKTDPGSQQASVAIARDVLTRLGAAPPPPAAGSRP